MASWAIIVVKLSLRHMVVDSSFTEIIDLIWCCLRQSAFHEDQKSPIKRPGVISDTGGLGVWEAIWRACKSASYRVGLSCLAMIVRWRWFFLNSSLGLIPHAVIYTTVDTLVSTFLLVATGRSIPYQSYCTASNGPNYSRLPGDGPRS